MQSAPLLSAHNDVRWLITNNSEDVQRVLFYTHSGHPEESAIYWSLWPHNRIHSKSSKPWKT